MVSRRTALVVEDHTAERPAASRTDGEPAGRPACDGCLFCHSRPYAAARRRYDPGMQIFAVVLASSMAVTAPAAPQPKDALTAQHLGLYAGDEYRLTGGHCSDCA